MNTHVMHDRRLTGLGVCWIGNMRYTRPLSLTDERKWQALGSLGARLYVVGFSAGMRPRAFVQGARFYLLPELPFALLRYAEMFTLGTALVLWIVLRRGVRVVVAQSPFEGAIGALVKNTARLFGRRVALVVESHGDFEVAVFTQRRVRFAAVYRWLMNRAARYGLRHADRLRAVSGSTKAQLAAWSPGAVIDQFMTWVDSEAFTRTPRAVPLAATRDIVCAAVLIPRKGIHTLLDAFAALAGDFPTAHLWLVGKPENQDYAAALRLQAERLGLAQRVTFVGAVSQQQVAGYLARARVLALASTSEGLPRVVMEAMLAGLVVVATRVSGTPEVIQDGVSGYLVPPEDNTALAAALRRALDDPQPEMMGGRARAFAQQFFSPAAYVENYRRLITGALEGRS